MTNVLEVGGKKKNLNYTFKSKHGVVHKNPKHVAVYHKEVGLIFFCCLAASRESSSESCSRAINALTQIGPRGSFSPSIQMI